MSKHEVSFWDSTAGVVVAVLMGAVGLPLVIGVLSCAGIFRLWQWNSSRVIELNQRAAELQVEIQEEEKQLAEQHRRQHERNGW